MEAFLTLAGQLFLIICVQSILEVMASARRQNHLYKVIFLACYLSCLLLVLNFMYQYFSQMMSKMWFPFF